MPSDKELTDAIVNRALGRIRDRKPVPTPEIAITVESMPHVGQRVAPLADIWDDGCDNHHPPGYFAQRGDILIVRAVDPGHEFPICVSHEHITDNSFRVALSEIEVEGLSMTETTILDESAVSEIEARRPFYFCNKCGYFGDTGPRHQHATGHPPFECRYNAVRPTSELTIDAFCATVKHLRARLAHDIQILDECEVLADRFLHHENALPKDFPSASEIIDALLKRMGALRAENKRTIEVTTHAYNEERDRLQSQLEQLRADSREQRDTIKFWQRHIQRMGQLLHCVAMDIDVEQAAKDLLSRLAQVEQERDDWRRKFLEATTDVSVFRTRAIQLCKDKAAEHDDEGRTTQRDLLLELAAEIEKL